MSHLITATDASGITTPHSVAGYRAARETRNSVYGTLDGGIGVAYRPAAPRSGTLTLVYPSQADAFAAATLLGRACPFVYSSSVANVGMRFAVNGTLQLEQDRAIAHVWYLDVPYQEVLV